MLTINIRKWLTQSQAWSSLAKPPRTIAVDTEVIHENLSKSLEAGPENER